MPFTVTETARREFDDLYDAREALDERVRVLLDQGCQVVVMARDRARLYCPNQPALDIHLRLTDVDVTVPEARTP